MAQVKLSIPAPVIQQAKLLSRLWRHPLRACGSTNACVYTHTSKPMHRTPAGFSTAKPCMFEHSHQESIDTLPSFPQGRVLRGTLLPEKPVVYTAAQELLEDENGDAVRRNFGPDEILEAEVPSQGRVGWEVSLYNFIPEFETGMEKQLYAEKILRRGLPIAIIEPYYKVFADGSQGVRVDNPAEKTKLSMAAVRILQIRWCSWIQSRPPQPRNGRQRPRSTLWETSMRRRCGAMQRRVAYGQGRPGYMHIHAVLVILFTPRTVRKRLDTHSGPTHVIGVHRVWFRQGMSPVWCRSGSHGSPVSQPKQTPAIDAKA
eukprot:scaffold68555_cov21-Tisochrysis_lutea.AAC.3